MIRVLARLLLWLLLLPALVLLLAPFTGTGSRLLVELLGRVIPLAIEYRSGTFAGELALARIAWRDADLSLELDDVELELAPGCLWRSRICLRHLAAAQLDIDVLPGTDSQSLDDLPGEGSRVVFPVSMTTDNLRLGGLRVHWDGGEWRQGSMAAGAELSGSTIRVHRARVQDARLELADQASSDERVVLPEVDLPLKLVVQDLLVERGSWDLYGSGGSLEQLHLKGQWSATKLALAELDVRSETLGDWDANGHLAFTGRWPLAVTARTLLPEVAGWPQWLARDVQVTVGGDLAALSVAVDSSAGQVDASLSGTVDTLDPQLSFTVQGSAAWPGQPAVTDFLDLPAALAELHVIAPLALAASGNLESQVFQVGTTISAPGYPSLGVNLAGSLQPGRLELDDLRLQDSEGANTLWGRGELNYADGINWSAALETSGFELPPLTESVRGRIEGQLQLKGCAGGDTWTATAARIELAGTINGLDATMSGYAGLDSQLRLLPSELRAEVKGTRLTLVAGTGQAAAADLELALEDIGTWLPEARGSLALKATATVDWQSLTFTGSVADIRWDALAVDHGRISGNYQRGGRAALDADMTLDNPHFGELEFDSLTLGVRADEQRQAVSLAASGDIDGTLEIAGERVGDKGWSGQLAPTTLQTEEGNWYLGEPVAMAFSTAPARLSLAAHCWQFRNTRVCPGAASLGEEGSASLTLDGDLEVLTAVLPAYLELQGQLGGELSASWSTGQPLSLAGDLQARNILFTRHFDEGNSGSIAWQRLAAKLHRDSTGLVLDAEAYNGDSRDLAFNLALPADRSQALRGAIQVEGLQLAALAPLAPDMSVLQGVIEGSLALSGSVDDPRMDGILRLSGGHFALLGNPTELQQLQLEVNARGDHAQVSGAGLLGGGRLDISGELASAPWRLDLALQGERNEILLPPYTRMLVSENLQFGLTPALLDLKGNITVHEGSLEHEQLPEGSVSLSDDVVEVDLTGNVIYEANPFDLRMNVGLLIADNFRIQGNMVDATVGGDLQLRQQPRQPLQLFGNLNVIGGELRAYQQRLRIQRGTVSFSGNPENPELDVRAQREISADNVVVGLQLQGTLEQPKLEVFSDPLLSQGEAMSYLVRGRGLDSGASADGVAMALSVGTGLVNQTALVAELNSIPGISNLSFGAEGSTESDTAATVGGYIGDRLYLSYGLGIYEPINVLTARLYLQTRLWLEVVSRLENSVDLYYSFDIE